MNMKKLVAAAALALMVVGTQAGAETLRVGSETVYPPFEFLDSNSGKYVGFDIDLIDEVAKRAGFEPQILSMGLDSLIPALMSGSIDVAVSALTITPERAAKVDFTKPYYESGLSIMARKDDASIKGVKGLENKVLCAEIGSSGSVFMSKIKGAKIRTFNSAGEAFLQGPRGHRQRQARQRVLPDSEGLRQHRFELGGTWNENALTGSLFCHHASGCGVSSLACQVRVPLNSHGRAGPLKSFRGFFADKAN